MRIRGFEAGIVALHIHLPATSQTDFPEIQEPDLEGRFTGCADGIARRSTREVPVQKGKTEAQIVHRRANEVLSQRQFCRARMLEVDWHGNVVWEYRAPYHHHAVRRCPLSRH